MSLADIAGRRPKAIEGAAGVSLVDVMNKFPKQYGGIFDFFHDNDLKQFSVFHLSLKYKRPTHTSSVDEFIAFAKSEMGNEYAKVSSMTQGQSNCHQWFEMCFARITASNVYEASRCNTPNGM